MSKEVNKTISLNKESLEDFVKTMFVFVRERAKKDGSDSFPSHIELKGVAIEAIKSITLYAKTYGVDPRNRDSIKLFAFAAAHFNKRLNNFLRPRGFKMEDEVVYLSCLDFIATVYQGADFSKHPDLKNTMRILNNIVLNTDELSSYIYIKGLQEGIICTEKV